MTLSQIFKRGYSRTRLEILTLILMICFYIQALFLLPFTLFFLMYQKLVILFTRLFRPDLTHVMSSGNSWVALENITTRAKANIIIGLILDNQFDLESAVGLFQSKILERRRMSKSRDGTRSPGPGPLIYPELKQIYTEFGGYFFWKDESNFNLKEHIRPCDYDYNFEGSKSKSKSKSESESESSPVCTEEELRELSSRLLSKSWKPDFSPWEILYIPQYQSQSDVDGSTDEKGADKPKMKSALIIRFHHVMGDGKGWLTMLLEDLIEMKDCKIAVPTLPSPTRSFWRILTIPLKIPYDCAKNHVESLAPRNPWRTEGKRSKEYYTSFSPSFSTQYIKDIKNKLGVGYNAVLISAISGGIRRVMQQGGQTVPEKLVGAVAVPLPNHPGGICIHAALMCLSWPVGIADARCRLASVHQDIMAHRNSLAPLGYNIFIARQFAIFPNFFRRMIYNKVETSLGVSLFPGPNKTLDIYGAKAVDSFLLIGLPSGQCGAGVWTLVIGGKTRVVVNIDKTLFPSKTEFEKLGDYIFDELRILHEMPAESSTFDLHADVNSSGKNCKESIV